VTSWFGGADLRQPSERDVAQPSPSGR